ncbi:hypothetical protein BQ8794_240315 [Mesorhizobium prunaredense]|uniref:Uncharacterized protein n=1 Tax=Mesorhizobium prunaredense TaxID=1631249 RepID=A0A1R3VCK8_9HYPH|nr:hypothetical protein BQ8794_240315 [Mesorhizobium prunaredense]
MSVSHTKWGVFVIPISRRRQTARQFYYARLGGTHCTNPRCIGAVNLRLPLLLRAARILVGGYLLDRSELHCDAHPEHAEGAEPWRSSRFSEIATDELP